MHSAGKKGAKGKDRLEKKKKALLRGAWRQMFVCFWKSKQDSEVELEFPARVHNCQILQSGVAMSFSG